MQTHYIEHGYKAKATGVRPRHTAQGKRQGAYLLIWKVDDEALNLQSEIE